MVKPPPPINWRLVVEIFAAAIAVVIGVIAVLYMRKPKRRKRGK